MEDKGLRVAEDRLDAKKDSGYGSQGVLGLERFQVNLLLFLLLSGGR